MVVSIWWVILAFAVGTALTVMLLAMLRMSSKEEEHADRMLKESKRRPLDGNGPPTVSPPVKPVLHVEDDRLGGVSTVG